MLGFLDVLYLIFIKPLQLIFETIYMVTNGIINDPGLSIIALSLIMNILVLPLYMRADAMQEHERIMEQKMRRGVAHIKKTFKGDERTMMLQTYYRQNDYKPTDVFKGSVSLFLEIPFFIAAYLFLSNLQLLQDVSFGPITNLGAPDGLIQIGDMSLNALPFIMTGINLVSCIIFTKGSSTKQKIQLYGMAIFFLIFLYSSPSGLVFYWTLNNVFALGKTIVYKIVGWRNKQESKVQTDALKNRNANAKVKSAEHAKSKAKKALEPNNKIYFFGALLLTVLVGAFIPLTIIGSSPQEFIDTFTNLHPLWYVANALCLAAGLFMVWMSVFYWLANKRAKVVFEAVVWIFCGIALLSFFYYGNTMGTLSNTLEYEEGMVFADSMELVYNGLALAGLAAVLVLLFKFAHKLVPWVLAACVAGLIGVSYTTLNPINTSVAEALAIQEENQAQDGEVSFTLSTTGQNVIMIMLDRAMGEFIPYIMQEKPELLSVYDGFTYYSNLISFGGHTNIAGPAVYGGYEYTPTELNKRSSELLVTKHNESLLMLPVLFSQNNYDVTVIDPPNANYSWTTNTRIFDAYPEINAYVTDGTLQTIDTASAYLTDNKRNLFCFSLMKCLPLAAQPLLYAEGTYNNSEASTLTHANDGTNATAATGSTRADFLSAYNVLASLPAMTNITTENKNTYMVMTNLTTHQITNVQEPDYVPSATVDNSAYEAQIGERTVNGETLRMSTTVQQQHYQSNMAALLKIGEWLTYLKKAGVYDNTRIILCSDHGFYTHSLASLEKVANNDDYDMERYMPLLMVKDFNATGFTTSTEFMTNADVPTISVSGLIENATNPFTGKAINNLEKTAHPQYVYMSWNYDIAVNNGTTFIADASWLEVSGDARNMDNWKVVSEPAS